MRCFLRFGALLLFILLFLLESAALSSTIYVKPDGDDAGTGESWELAKRTVQAGIDAAAPTGGEIWVAAGVYYGEVILRNNCYLYGGFNGTETDLSQRNWKQNVTVLDGQKSETVVKVLNTGSSCRIDGFTIRNGTSSMGAGIYCSNASPTIANNIITCNNYGAACDSTVYGMGLYLANSSSIVTNNIIVRNGLHTYSSPTPSVRGGGIYCLNSDLVIVNNTISGNAGSSIGAGIYLDASKAVIANNIVSGNASGIRADSSLVRLQNNCIYGNASSDYFGISPDPTDICLNPRLVDAGYDRLHIQPDSPCVDAGDDASVTEALDIDCEARIQGTHVDIGADESDGTTWPVGSAVVRVSPTGDDANDGSSWALAKRSVQAGVDAASSVGGEVWVAEGVYYETLSLTRDVYLYGGFDGTETDRSQRDWKQNVTVLDGQLQSTVIVADGLSSLAAIDGFTIRNGSGVYAGAISCSYSHLSIANNIITGSVSSGSETRGAIYCSYSSPTIYNNIITANYLDFSPSYIVSGVYCFNSSPMIKNNTIIRNGSSTPTYGRANGIYCENSSSLISNNLIAKNTGNGISVLFTSGNIFPVIINNTIVEHSPQGSASAFGISVSAERGSGSFATVCNNIIACNAYGFAGTSANSILRNNCVYAANKFQYGYLYISPGPGDIQQDPLFVDMLNEDYHLSYTSPCRDAGTDDWFRPEMTDIDGDSRFHGLHVDMGADEYHLLAAAPVFSPASGLYNSAVDVAITCATAGSVIRYTTDGRDPTIHDPIVNGPVTVSGSLLLKARAWHPDRSPSPVSSANYLIDLVVPTGGVSINSGAVYTNSPDVTFAISSAEDHPDITEMRFRNDTGAWSEWETYTTSKNWTLGADNGIRRVEAEFRNAAGEVYNGYVDTIVLDTEAPSGAVIINSGSFGTNYTTVSLQMNGVDNFGPLMVSLSNDGTVWTEWEEFIDTRQWDLTSGEGTKTVYVRFRDAAGNVSSVCSDSIIFDITPPTGSVSINSGQQFTASQSVLLYFTAHDTGSGIYQVRMSNDGVDWSPWSLYASPKSWTLSYANGVTTVYVQFMDHSGYVSSVCTDDIILDTTPPTTPIVADEGAYTSGSDKLSFTWQSSDSVSGIAEYKYAIGLSLYDLLVDWKSAGTSTEVQESGLALEPDRQYYCFVKAKNGVNVWSSVGSSDGIIAARLASLGEAKTSMAGHAVFLSGLTVTSTFDDTPGFWLQALDRSAGIKAANHNVQRGYLVDAAGIVRWVDGVPVLMSSELKRIVAGNEVSPLGFATSALANDRREDLNYAGINPVGLLVTVWGRVTALDEAAGVFYVDDGSHLADGMGPVSNPYIGLRVAYKAGMIPPPVDKYVRVTGIRTVEKVTLAADAVVNGEARSAGETIYLPVLCLRDQPDIVILK